MYLRSYEHTYTQQTQIIMYRHRTHAQIDSYVYRHTPTCTHANTYIHMRAHTHTYRHTRMHTCMRAHTDIHRLRYTQTQHTDIIHRHTVIHRCTIDTCIDTDTHRRRHTDTHDQS